MESNLNGKSPQKKDKDLFHVIHKVPSGDGPYVRAKHAQLVEKDPETAIVWFWKAINAGDRVDSALKDMAVVMKQLDRTEEAIEAIKSFRRLCPRNAQESLDNVLIDLYKKDANGVEHPVTETNTNEVGRRVYFVAFALEMHMNHLNNILIILFKKCGKVDEQIVLLKHKLKLIYLGEAFNGRPTKTARSHGKKFQVSIRQETSRILGNLGWAYMQKSNFMAAEVVYRKAQMIDADANKALNLCHCLIKQARDEEADVVLQDVLQRKLPGSDDPKSRNRADELLMELESRNIGFGPISPDVLGLNFEDDFVEALERAMNEWAPTRSKRLPIFEEISQFRDQLAC